MPAIQVVLLDLGGTLLHYEQPPQYSFEALNALAFAPRFSAWQSQPVQRCLTRSWPSAPWVAWRQRWKPKPSAPNMLTQQR